MARTVGFHGRVIVHPGAEAYVDLTGMVQPGVTVEDVAGVIGEAPYGEPGAVHIFADADSARQYFGEGSELADGIRLLFSPSNDERVEGGATLVYAYKTNQSTQAERWLVTDPAAGILAYPTTDAALYGQASVGGTPRGPTDPENAYVEIDHSAGPASYADNTFQNLIVEVISGWGSGKGNQQRQVSSSVDQGGSVHRLYLREDLDWDIPPYRTGITTRVRIAIPQQKLIATEWGTRGLENKVEHGPSNQKQGYELNSTYSNRVENPASTYGGLVKPPMWLRFDPTGGGDSSTWKNPANWIFPQALSGGLPVGGKTAGGGSTATLLNGGSNVTDDDQNNRWVVITDGTSAQAEYIGRMYKIKKSNVAGTVELYEPGLGAVPGNDLEWKVISLTDTFVEIKGEDGEATSLEVFTQDTPDGTVNAAVSLFSISLPSFATLDALVQRINQIPGMLATLGEGVDGDLSSDRFDFGERSEHYGRQQIGVIDSTVANPAAAGDTTIELDANWNAGAYFPTGTFDPFPLRITKPDGSIQETVWVTANSGTVLTIIGQGTGGGLVNSWADGDEVYRMANEELVYFFGSQLLYGPGEPASGPGAVLGYPLKDNCQALVDYVVTGVDRFTSERAIGPGSDAYKDEIGANQPENDLGVFNQFYNGEAGFSVVNQPEETNPNYPVSWEHGFDTLLKEKDIRVIVPFASEDKSNWTEATGNIDTLVNLFQEHLLDAEDAKAERLGYLGLRLPLEARTISGVTYGRGLVEWAQYLNESRMALMGQEVKVFRSNGAEDWLQPWAMACQAAGIQLGTDLGEGLTLKYIKISDLRQPFNDWDPRDRADLRTGILGGIFMAEPYKGRFRVIRGLTTHVSTDNLARTDINVREIRNFVMRDLRDLLEERFGGVGIGAPGEGVRFVAPGNIASIREYVADILEEYRADGLIIDSEDEQGQTVHAWTGLSVRISGDIARVKVQIFPKTALNFILIDFAFQLPVLTA